MNYNEFMDALLSNDKSGSNFSCFTDEDLREFVSYGSKELAQGKLVQNDLFRAFTIAFDELQRRECTVETK